MNKEHPQRQPDSDRDFESFISQWMAEHWNLVGALAWEGYRDAGRGTLVIHWSKNSSDPDLEFLISYQAKQTAAENAMYATREWEHLVEEYDPREELLVVFERVHGNFSKVQRVRGAEELPPREAHVLRHLAQESRERSLLRTREWIRANWRDFAADAWSQGRGFYHIDWSPDSKEPDLIYWQLEQFGTELDDEIRVELEEYDIDQEVWYLLTDYGCYYGYHAIGVYNGLPSPGEVGWNKWMLGKYGPPSFRFVEPYDDEI